MNSNLLHSLDLKALDEEMSKVNSIIGGTLSERTLESIRINAISDKADLRINMLIAFYLLIVFPPQFHIHILNIITVISVMPIYRLWQTSKIPYPSPEQQMIRNEVVNTRVLPLIKDNVDTILWNSDWYNDTQVENALWDLREVYIANWWKEHLWDTQEKHPYIGAWLYPKKSSRVEKK